MTPSIYIMDHIAFIVCSFTKNFTGLKWIELSLSREILTLLYANNKDADQPALPRSLISINVIHFMKVLWLHLLQAKFPDSRKSRQFSRLV